MTYIEAIILAIIEGFTEFLPISSTGHMVIASAFMGTLQDDFTKAFEVMIQFPAILAVLFLYWKKFLPNWPFYKKIFTAFLPTAVLGFLLKSKVDQWLESTSLVAWTMLIGGVILVLSDRWFKNSTNKTIDYLSNKDCVKIGFFQSIAMIPGVSRSGSTILGGLFLGMNKKDATEFSFFLAVPTMAAATAYKGIKILIHSSISTEQLKTLSIGCVTSFLVSILAIKFFIGIVQKYGFKFFGYYRILLGLCILFLIYNEVIQ